MADVGKIADMDQKPAFLETANLELLDEHPEVGGHHDTDVHNRLDIQQIRPLNVGGVREAQISGLKPSFRGAHGNTVKPVASTNCFIDGEYFDL